MEKELRWRFSKLTKALSYFILIHLNILSASQMCRLEYSLQGPFYELAAPTAWELDEAHDAEHALKTRLFIHCHKALLLPYFLQAFFEVLLTPSSIISLFWLQTWTIAGCLQKGFPTKKLAPKLFNNHQIDIPAFWSLLLFTTKVYS